MKPLPMIARAAAALRLGPMTIRTLADCLTTNPSYLRRRVDELEACGVVRTCGQAATPHSRPAHLFEIAR